MKMRSLCNYCTKALWKLEEHLISKHNNKPEVQQLMKFPTDSKERKALVSKIRAEAAYRNDLKVQKTGKGIIKQLKKEIYEPCQYCFKLITKHNLPRHIIGCKTIFENIGNKMQK
jgi:hypothetical protein